jgi:hypothetical protein
MEQQQQHWMELLLISLAAVVALTAAAVTVTVTVTAVVLLPGSGAERKLEQPALLLQLVSQRLAQVASALLIVLTPL